MLGTERLPLSYAVCLKEISQFMSILPMAINNAGHVIEQNNTKSTYTFNRESSTWNNLTHFVKRSVLTKPENLNHCTLTIEQRMKLDETKSGVNFIPENPFNNHMLKLFLDEESSDVLFEVPNSDGNSSMVHYHAHQLVLKACAPTLAHLCEGSDNHNPVLLTDVEPEVFLRLHPDWKNEAKKFINAADRYGITELKMEAEAWYITYSNFTVGNAIDELLCADTNNCPLLREAAMDFVVKNAKEVTGGDRFSDSFELI